MNTLTVVAVLALGVSLILPAVQRSRESAARLGDLNSARQLGHGLLGHEVLFGKLPGPYSGGTNSSDGWSLAVVNVLDRPNVFLPNAALDRYANLSVAATERPGYFVAPSIADYAFTVKPVDAAQSTLNVGSTQFVFNGFLFSRRIAGLNSSNTVLLARLADAGPWSLSPACFALPSNDNTELHLLVMADGSAHHGLKSLTTTWDPDRR